MHNSRQDRPRRNKKSGGEVAEQSAGSRKEMRLAKTDVRYWEAKLFHDGYTRDGERVQQAFWSVRIQHAGRRETFSLGSANKTVAGGKARDIFLSLKAGGWEAALQAHKPDAAKPVISDATVGDLLREVGAIGGLKAKTFADYAKSLRKIAADIQGIKGGKDKFNPHTGGRQKWLEKVEAIPLAEITPERIQKWKLSFLRKASSDPASQRRAKISVNSLLRQAKSLFSKKVVRFLSFKLPTPPPFEGVDFEPRQTMRYHSTVNAKVLIKAAVDELAVGDGDKPEQYKVFLLSLCAGLRRNEIDKLEWEAFDFDKHLIRIQATEFFHPKTEDSSGDVEIDPEIAAVFEALHDGAGGRFVVKSDRMAMAAGGVMHAGMPPR